MFIMKINNIRFYKICGKWSLEICLKFIGFLEDFFNYGL